MQSNYISISYFRLIMLFFTIRFLIFAIMVNEVLGCLRGFGLEEEDPRCTCPTCRTCNGELKPEYQTEWTPWKKTGWERWRSLEEVNFFNIHGLIDRFRILLFSMFCITNILVIIHILG